MKDFGVKHFVAMVFFAAIGLVIGRLSPQAQIRGLEQQLAAAKECAPAKRSTGTDVARMFQGKPWTAPEPEPPTNPPSPEPEAVVSEDEGDFKLRLEDDDGSDDLLGDDGIGDDTIDTMREAMELRIAQTEQALAESDLSEQQIERIHEVTDTLNDDLTSLARDLVDQVAGKEPSRREMMMLAADTLDAVISAETSMLDAVSEADRANLDEKLLDPMAYIEPDVVEILAELDR